VHIERARELRKRPSDAEVRLWSRLRRRALAGYRFRRQTPIGRYFVDFFCPERRLVVEVDGGQHAFQLSYDKVRTEWLESRGYRVIRFWASDVLRDTDVVLEGILRALRDDRQDGDFN
jgi:adenine-specific DNA-methyltransferase